MKLRQSKHTSLNIGSSFRDKRRLVFAAALLGIGAAAFVCPIPRTLKQAASAETGDVTPTISLSKSGLVGLSPVAGGVASEGTITVTSATTNYTGYDLYLTSSDGKMTMLSYGSGDELAGQTIDSLTGATSASSSDFIDKWGYRVGDSGNYDAAPTTIGTTGNVVHSSAASSDATTLGFAARVGQTKPQGAYKGSLTLTAVVNPNKAYDITYDINTSDDTATGLPASVSGQKNINSITIPSEPKQTPTRTYYLFQGYCTTQTTDGETCSGTTYAAGGTITLDPTTNNEMTLYAMWKIETRTITFSSADSAQGTVSPTGVTAAINSAIEIDDNTVTVGGNTVTATANDGYAFDSWTNNCGTTLTSNCTIEAKFVKIKTLADITTMQEMTTAICNATAIPTASNATTQYQLKDTRDNKLYWVAKLLDGNCWMTQNLDFNINENTVKYLSGTGLPSGEAVSGYSDISSIWAPSSTYYTKTATSSSSANTDYYSWDLGNYYYNPSGNTGWTSCGTSANSYADCTNYGFSTEKPSTDAKGTTLSSNEAEHYQVGTLYQWCAATAGTCSSATSSGATASGSICPAGWRLPYSGNNTTTKGFGYLLSQYGLTSSYDKTTISASPLFFVSGGRVLSGTLWFAGYYGDYWSSQANSSSNAYDLYFYSSGVYPSLNNSRYYGNSVRCVAR